MKLRTQSTFSQPAAWDDVLISISARGVVPMAVGTGTSGNDIITSGSGSDSLEGLQGNDTLNGGGGDDTLNGGSGNDSMTGGTGNDVYFVDSSADLVIEASGGGLDVLRTAMFLTVLPQNVENLTNGTNKGAILIGNGLGNVITGGNAGDILSGQAGIDTLKGGLGDDTYVVDTAGDVVSEASGAGLDEVVTDIASYTMTGNVELAFVTSTRGSMITGNVLDNEIQGGIGNDTLKGMDGEDGLFGNTGHDTLTGGSSGDYFVFNTAIGASNTDVITDFSSSQGDYISLQNTGSGLFTALPSGALAASAFKLIGPGGAAVDSTDRILYNKSTGQLYYDSDGSGGSSAVLFATLTNFAVLGATDFFIY